MPTSLASDPCINCPVAVNLSGAGIAHNPGDLGIGAHRRWAEGAPALVGAGGVAGGCGGVVPGGPGAGGAGGDPEAGFGVDFHASVGSYVCLKMLGLQG